MAPAVPTEDYYSVLQVNPNATLEVITRSYRQLALKLHPDRNSSANATADFQRLSRAYTTLSDASSRREYDLFYPSVQKPSGASYFQTQTASQTQTQTATEAERISSIRTLKEQRRERWRTRKFGLDTKIFGLEKDIRTLKHQIQVLNTITAAVKAEEAWRNGWTAWLISPVYRQSSQSEEKKAQKDREQQERRLETDMKERRLNSKEQELKKAKSELTTALNQVTLTDQTDDEKIRVIEAAVQARVEAERLAKFRAECLRQQRERELREQREREERMESLRKFEAQREEQARKAREELDGFYARYQKQQAAEAKRARSSTTYGPTSSSSSCLHGDWWRKVLGRATCMRCHDTWNYLLECPGCKMRACPKCQAQVRPSRRHAHRRQAPRGSPPPTSYWGDDYYYY